MKVGIAITQDFYLAGEIRILVFNMLLDTRSKHILVLNTGSLLIIGLKIKNRWQNLMKFLPIQMSLWWQEGMEISIEKIFLAQKVMIYKCDVQGNPSDSNTDAWST